MGNRTLYRYLPRLAQVFQEERMPLEIVVRHFIESSEVVKENGTWDGLSMRGLEEAYFTILRILETRPDDHAISRHLQDKMEARLEEDVHLIRRISHKGSSNCLRTFLAIAEVSSQTESRRLGQILVLFFLANNQAIIDTESSIHFRRWHTALHIAYIHPQERRKCVECLLKPRYERANTFSDRSWSLSPRTWRGEADLLDHDEWNGRGRYWDGYPPQTHRSWTPPPERRLIEPSVRRMYSAGDLITRPSSAPGDRQIAHQARKVMEFAAGLQDEARLLKNMALS